MKLIIERSGSRLEFDGDSQEYEKHIASLVEKHFLSTPKNALTTDSGVPQNNSDGIPSAGNNVSMTMKSIAALFDVKSGPELLYAACAWLTGIEGKEKFTRQEILTAMKSAIGYYKPSDSGNLSKYIDSSQKNGTLIEVSNNTFAVKADHLKKMSEKIASGI